MDHEIPSKPRESLTVTPGPSRTVNDQAPQHLGGSRVQPRRFEGQPSSLYRADLWRLGIWAVNRFPRSAGHPLGRFLGHAYWQLNSRRREIVIQNLLPALAGDRARAKGLSCELFQQFALKIADLWRYESGVPADDLVCESIGWEHLTDAQQRGRGILLLTPHLGNWELGAPLLAQRGFKIIVITLHEPDSRLTALRKASRARWGIETLIIGNDPFAFVDVIGRLEAGAIVALLIDRPTAYSAIEVTLFGRPFAASIAAAELARASGCGLVPVFLPRVAEGYKAEMLPEIQYDRAALGSRQARQRLTQEIMSTFEPIIQQYLTQWYHFVPIWPQAC